jgi:hypothetical protein
VHETEAASDGEIAVGDEPIAQLQAVREALALLVGVRGDGDDLGARGRRVGQRSSKPLELEAAERSPVPPVEDEHDRLAAAVVGEAHGTAPRVAEGEIRRRLADA